MKHSYTTCGTCARQINFEIDENGKLRNVSFIGGCNGNLKAIGKLVEGQDASAIADLLKGSRHLRNPVCHSSASDADPLQKAVHQAGNRHHQEGRADNGR